MNEKDNNVATYTKQVDLLTIKLEEVRKEVVSVRKDKELLMKENEILAKSQATTNKIILNNEINSHASEQSSVPPAELVTVNPSTVSSPQTEQSEPKSTPAKPNLPPIRRYSANKPSVPEKPFSPDSPKSVPIEPPARPVRPQLPHTANLTNERKENATTPTETSSTITTTTEKATVSEKHLSRTPSKDASVQISEPTGFAKVTSPEKYVMPPPQEKDNGALRSSISSIQNVFSDATTKLATSFNEKRKTFFTPTPPVPQNITISGPVQQATTTTTTITTTTTAPLKPVPPPKPIIPQQNIAETVIEKKPLDQLITKPLPTPGARRILPKPPENN